MVGGYTENPETGAKLDRSQVQVRETDIFQLEDIGEAFSLKWTVIVRTTVHGRQSGHSDRKEVVGQISKQAVFRNSPES